MADFVPEILLLEWYRVAFNPRSRSRYQACLTLGSFEQSRIVWLNTKEFFLTSVQLTVGSFKFCKTQGIILHVSLVYFRSIMLAMSATCNFCSGLLFKVLL